MSKKRLLWIAMGLLIVVAMIVSACGSTATTTTTRRGDHHSRRRAGGSVGVVLPTKDEPRWIQDETRFNDAFKAAGVDVQILFSQGDSAVEKKNVESLISSGRQSDHHLPAGRHRRGSRCR